MVTQTDDIRVSGDAPEPKEDESLSSKPIIGIIYPPPEVRNIVDKTASFVGRNGPEFESRIRQNEINNSKFNFLNNNDPYHAYYRLKVKEFIEGKAKEPLLPKPVAQPTVKPSVAAVQEQFIPKDPPPPYEFILDPSSIDAYEIDVVKLTAQFVAKNGRTFLTQLMQREAKNYQFDFLRPQHNMFQYFTKLVEQYQKILICPKSTLRKLEKEIENPKVILDDVKYRVAWRKHEDRLKLREKQAIEKERAMYAQIDWHDFVVVETVDFHVEERGNFPKPVSVEELGSRLLQQERLEKFGEDAVREEESDEEEEAGGRVEASKAPPPAAPQLVDMDMEESSDEEVYEEPQRATLKPPAPPKITPMENMIIKKNYNPKSRRDVVEEKQGPSDNYTVSPITGERIPAHKINEHMRYGLLDPNWKELNRKQVAEKQQEEEVFAEGSAIEASLHRLAERRTDIFGVEETGIGQKVGEEETPAAEKVSWDGFSNTASQTRQQAKSNVTVEEQLLHIRKTQGTLVDESLEKIGPKTTPSNPAASQTQASKPQPASAPVTTNPVILAPQAPVLTPVTPIMVRPVMQQPAPPVLVVQQPVQVVRPPQRQIIAVPRPPMMMTHHPMMPTQIIQPMQMQMGVPMGMDGGPPHAKKPRTEADLVPASVFLQQSSGMVTFRVQCPNAPEKAEWNLQGQTLTFSLPLADEVSVIKAKVHEATGMPAGKQKLQLDGLFIKDSNSLAFYNMVSGALVTLQVKERGGRKK